MILQVLKYSYGLTGNKQLTDCWWNEERIVMMAQHLLDRIDDNSIGEDDRWYERFNKLGFLWMEPIEHIMAPGTDAETSGLLLSVNLF